MKTRLLDEFRLTLLEKKPKFSKFSFLFTCQPFAMFEKTERLKTFFHGKSRIWFVILELIIMVFSVTEIIADSIHFVNH